MGLECLSPSSISLLLALQIPCSLIAKLISNSCAPCPTRLREIKKRAPVHRLLPCWVYVIGLGLNEKVQNTVEHIPIFFLGLGLDCCCCFQPFSSKSPLTRVLHAWRHAHIHLQTYKSHGNTFFKYMFVTFISFYISFSMLGTYRICLGSD